MRWKYTRYPFTENPWRIPIKQRLEKKLEKEIQKQQMAASMRSSTTFLDVNEKDSHQSRVVISQSNIDDHIDNVAVYHTEVSSNENVSFKNGNNHENEAGSQHVSSTNENIFPTAKRKTVVFKTDKQSENGCSKDEDLLGFKDSNDATNVDFKDQNRANNLDFKDPDDDKIIQDIEKLLTSNFKSSMIFFKKKDDNTYTVCIPIDTMHGDNVPYLCNMMHHGYDDNDISNDDINHEQYVEIEMDGNDIDKSPVMQKYIYLSQVAKFLEISIPIQAKNEFEREQLSNKMKELISVIVNNNLQSANLISDFISLFTKSKSVELNCSSDSANTIDIEIIFSDDILDSELDLFESATNYLNPKNSFTVSTSMDKKLKKLNITIKPNNEVTNKEDSEIFNDLNKLIRHQNYEKRNIILNEIKSILNKNDNISLADFTKVLKSIYENEVSTHARKTVLKIRNEHNLFILLDLDLKVDDVNINDAKEQNIVIQKSTEVNSDENEDHMFVIDISSTDVLPLKKIISDNKQNSIKILNSESISELTEVLYKVNPLVINSKRLLRRDYENYVHDMLLDCVPTVNIASIKARSSLNFRLSKANMTEEVIEDFNLDLYDELRCIDESLYKRKQLLAEEKRKIESITPLHNAAETIDTDEISTRRDLFKTHEARNESVSGSSSDYTKDNYREAINKQEVAEKRDKFKQQELNGNVFTKENYENNFVFDTDEVSLDEIKLRREFFQKQESDQNTNTSSISQDDCEYKDHNDVIDILEISNRRSYFKNQEKSLDEKAIRKQLNPIEDIDENEIASRRNLFRTFETGPQNIKDTNDNATEKPIKNFSRKSIKNESEFFSLLKRRREQSEIEDENIENVDNNNNKSEQIKIEEENDGGNDKNIIENGESEKRSQIGSDHENINNVNIPSVVDDDVIHTDVTEFNIPKSESIASNNDKENKNDVNNNTVEKTTTFDSPTKKIPEKPAKKPSKNFSRKSIKNESEFLSLLQRRREQSEIEEENCKIVEMNNNQTKTEEENNGGNSKNVIENFDSEKSSKIGNSHDKINDVDSGSAADDVIRSDNTETINNDKENKNDINNNTVEKATAVVSPKKKIPEKPTKKPTKNFTRKSIKSESEFLSLLKQRREQSEIENENSENDINNNQMKTEAENDGGNSKNIIKNVDSEKPSQIGNSHDNINDVDIRNIVEGDTMHNETNNNDKENKNDINNNTVRKATTFVSPKKKNATRISISVKK